MNAEPHPAKAIFWEAVEQHAPEQWAAFLDRACAGQPELRRRVELLLQAHCEAGTGPAVTVDDPICERPGNGIDPYKLLEEIGEGGFGVVFLAEQSQPVRRKVALKVLKPGMDTRQIVARFEAERQALAVMDHPNIAHIFDGGQTESGRPYFVMELVRGVSITDYCDQNHLTIRERLELFVHVCQAVHHAHQKGIIHRDIKPSNVMVTQHDGAPVVKVIDFGIAKALGQQLTEKTLVTGLGVVVGTLGYMSPEQAESNQIDIDTRSDIYSLGALLYELLAGQTPLDCQHLKEAGMLEMLRRVREEEPPSPSDRLRSSSELPKLSEQRGLVPARLIRLVRGELDWIVMKTLEKKRNRRYETVAGLTDDLQRYLADEPIQAAPPGIGYRFRKFLKRRRKLLVAAGIFVALLVGLIGTSLLALRLHETRSELQAKMQREKDERHAKQIDLAQRALERHDLAEAERVLGQIDTVYEQTWEQRHLRWLCSRVHRLDSILGGNRLNGPLEFENSVAFSPDGIQMAFPVQHKSGGWMLKVCELATGREIISIPIGLTVFSKPVFSPDGRRIALARAAFGGTGWDHGFVAVFDARKGERVLTLRAKSWVEEGDLVQSFAFTADGRSLMAKNLDEQVSVWDLADGRETSSLPGPTGQIQHLQFGPEGKLIATSHAGRASAKVWLWDGGSGKPKLRLRKEWHQPAGLIKMAFSPDGRLMAIKGSRGAGPGPENSHSELYIYNTDTGQVNRAIQVPNASSIDGLAFSGDGRFVIVQSFPRGLYVYDAATGQEKHLDGLVERDSTNEAINNRIDCFAVSADGQRIAAGFLKGTVTVWNLQTGKTLFTPKDLLALDGSNHLPAIMKMAFSPDGRRLGYCRDWGTGEANPENRSWVKILDLDTKRIELTIPLRSHPFYVERLAFSSDGQRIIALNRIGSNQKKGAITEWDLATGEVRKSLDEPDNALALAYLPDGSCLAARGGKGSVDVQDLPSGKRRLTLKNRVIGPIDRVALSPDGSATNGRLMASVCAWQSSGQSGFGTVKLWARGNEKNNRLIKFPGHTVLRVIITGDTAHIITYGPQGVRGWDEETTGPGGRTIKDDILGAACSVAISPDGRLIAAGGKSNNVKIWDAHTREERRTFAVTDPDLIDTPLGKEGYIGPVGSVCFSSDSRRLIAAIIDKTIRVWDVQTGLEELTLRGHRHRIVSVAWSADGRRIVSNCLDGTLRVWNAQTGQDLLEIPVSEKGAPLLAINPDGRSIIGPVKHRPHPPVVLDGETGRAKLVLQGASGAFRCAAFSQDGRRIVAGEVDGTVRVWSAATGEEQLVLKGHTGEVRCVAFSWDGQRIVSGGSGRAEPGGPQPGELKLWDAVSGVEKLSLKGHTGPVSGVAFSPDGQRIVSAGDAVRVWEAPVLETQAQR